MKAFLLALYIAGNTQVANGLTTITGARTSLLSDLALLDMKSSRKSRVDQMLAVNPQTTRELCDACVAAEEDLVSNQTVLEEALRNQSSSQSTLNDATTAYAACLVEELSLKSTADTDFNAVKVKVETGQTLLAALTTKYAAIMNEVNVPDPTNAKSAANPDSSFDGSGLYALIEAWEASFAAHATKKAECDAKNHLVGNATADQTSVNAIVTTWTSHVDAANATAIVQCDAMRSGSSATKSSCSDYLNTQQNTGDGVYSITGNGTDTFEVYCDMTTDGGGWIKLTTNRASNYWMTGWDPSKCGTSGDGTSAGGPQFPTGQTGADLTDADLDVQTSSNTQGEYAVITYSSNGVQLTAAQMQAIRGVSTQLSSHTALFAASCDDDVEQSYVSNTDGAQHEVYSKAVDGSSKMMIPTNGPNNKWLVYTYPDTAADIKYLLPEKFTYHHSATSGAGGGVEVVGWECQGCYSGSGTPDVGTLYILTK